MVGACCSVDASGGNLVFTVDVAPPLPPPLEFSLSIDRVGSFAKTGEATIYGTVTCSRPASVYLWGALKQMVGRISTISGNLSNYFECDGETPWSATASSENGLFKGGTAKVSVYADVYDPQREEWLYDGASRKVQLQGSP